MLASDDYCSRAISPGWGSPSDFHVFESSLFFVDVDSGCCYRDSDNGVEASKDHRYIAIRLDIPKYFDTPSALITVMDWVLPLLL